MAQKASLAKIAREILGLEEQYQAGPLDKKASARWNELVTQLFKGEEGYGRRRSFRLPVEIPATVKIRNGTFECRVREISRIGASLAAHAFGYITHEDSFRVMAMKIGGEDRPLDLACRIVRFDRADVPVAAVEFFAQNPPEALQAFFDQAYYPLYLQYLGELASS